MGEQRPDELGGADAPRGVGIAPAVAGALSLPLGRAVRVDADQHRGGLSRIAVDPRDRVGAVDVGPRARHAGRAGRDLHREDLLAGDQPGRAALGAGLELLAGRCAHLLRGAGRVRPVHRPEDRRRVAGDRAGLDEQRVVRWDVEAGGGRFLREEIGRVALLLLAGVGIGRVHLAAAHLCGAGWDEQSAAPGEEARLRLRGRVLRHARRTGARSDLAAERGRAARAEASPLRESLRRRLGGDRARDDEQRDEAQGPHYRPPRSVFRRAAASRPNGSPVCASRSSAWSRVTSPARRWTAPSHIRSPQDAALLGEGERRHHLNAETYERLRVDLDGRARLRQGLDPRHHLAQRRARQPAEDEHAVRLLRLLRETKEIFGGDGEGHEDEQHGSLRGRVDLRTPELLGDRRRVGRAAGRDVHRRQLALAGGSSRGREDLEPLEDLAAPRARRLGRFVEIAGRGERRGRGRLRERGRGRARSRRRPRARRRARYGTETGTVAQQFLFRKIW